MPYKQYIIENCSLIGLSYFGVNLAINPTWLTAIFSILGSICVIAYFLTKLHDKISFHFNGDNKEWFKKVIIGSFKNWFKRK